MRPPITNHEELTEKAIRYFAKETAKCTAPELVIKWCEKFAEVNEHQFSASHIYRLVKNKLEKVQTLTYLDTFQKVQLMFVLGQKMNKVFEKELRELDCKVEFDKGRRITSFRSADRRFVRFGEHHIRYFQGKVAKSSESALFRGNRQQGNQPGTSDAPENQDDSFQDVPEDEDDEEGLQDTPERINEDRREEKPLRFTAKDFEGAEPRHQMYGGEDAQPRENDHMQQENIDAASVKVKEEFAFNDKQRRMIEHYISVSYNYEIDNETRRNIESKFANGDLIFTEVPRGDEHFDESETRGTKRRVEDSMPIENKRKKNSENGASTSSPMQISGTKRTQTSRQMRSSGTTAKPNEPSTSSSIRGNASTTPREMLRGTQKRATPGVYLREVAATSPLASTFPRSKTSRTTSTSTEDLSVDSQSAPKVQNSVVSTQTSPPPSVTLTPKPEDKIINATKLAEQIETLADFFGFSELETKAGQVWSRIEDENKMIKPNKFNLILGGVLTALEGDSVETCEGESMMLKTLFKRIRNTLLRPLGKEIVTNPLELINKKIENLEKENNKEVVPMDSIRENLEFVLEMAATN